MKTEKVVCDFCASKSSQRLFSSPDFRLGGQTQFNFEKCQGCGLIFLNPRPTQSELYRFYPQDYWGKTKKRSRAEMLGDYGEVYRGVKKFKPKPGSLLDVGCGKGELLYLLKKDGWQVLGLELGKEAIDYGKKVLKVDIQERVLENSQFSQASFDAICFHHVLEHLPDPLKALKISQKLLKKKGLLAIAIPNPESINAKIFGRFWYPWEAPRHFYHFPSKTLKKVLEKNNFKIKKIEYFSKPSAQIGFRESFFRWLRRNRKLKKSLANETELAAAKNESKNLSPKSILINSLDIFSLIWGRFWAFFGKGDVLIVFAEKK